MKISDNIYSKSVINIMLHPWSIIYRKYYIIEYIDDINNSILYTYY